MDFDDFDFTYPYTLQSNTVPTSAPFDDPDGDLFVRTKDGVEMRVLKAILSRASPFFYGMFSITQLSEPCSFVELEETSKEMNILFRYMYPVPAPTITTLSELFSCLTLADKYDITPALDALKKAMLTPPFLNKDPVRMYAIACRFGYIPEAIQAARATLMYGLLQTSNLTGPGYDGFSAQEYNRLINWHGARVQQTIAILDTCVLTSASACTVCRKWGCSWWEPYKEAARKELQMRPASSQVYSADFMVDVLTGGRNHCENRWTMAFSDNTRLFLAALKTKIQSVRHPGIFNDSSLARRRDESTA